MNKKGNIVVLISFIFILFIVLFLGFTMAVGTAVMNWVFDIATPELSSLGMVGDTNMTEIAGFTITPLNSIVNGLTWMMGVLYVLMLIASVAVIVITKESSSRWLIGFYFMLVLILVMGSIFVSNMYEEFYDGTDELALRLQEQPILSYMILYSPAVFSIIAFLAGVIIFSGIQSEVSL